MRRVIALLALGIAACEPELTPMERAAKDRAECTVLAIDQSGFDPVTAEEPPRTIATSRQRGGDLKGGAVSAGKGALGGAVVGVAAGAVAGDAGKGAAAGAVAGGLIGGARYYKKSKETVTTTHPNPAYEEYAQAKAAYRHALEDCLAARAQAPK